MSIHSYCKFVSKSYEVIFFYSQYCIREYNSERQEVVSTDCINGFTTDNFTLPCVLNKTPIQPNEKATPNDICSINVKQTDIRQVMKCIDYIHQEFWTLLWEANSKKNEDE